MNGINFKIICRCCGKNIFKNPDDDEGFVSFFGTIDDAMLSLPKACYYHRLKSVVFFQTKDGNARKFIRNRFLHLLSKEEEEPDFDHICCSPNQVKLDSCFGDDQYIVCGMKRDETAHELFFNIIEAMFHQFIARNRYYFNIHTFIGQQINQGSFEDWKLCRHNHRHHIKYDSLISDTWEHDGNERHSNSRFCKDKVD